MRIRLRDYQISAVEAIRAAFKDKRTAPLLVLPTGGGKTVCFAHIMEGAHLKGNRCYLLVHRKELLHQASEQLSGLGVPHGIIAPGHAITAHLVQVASVQTLTRRLHLYKAPDLIVVDECHHSSSKTWMNILNHWPAAKRLGVTATPRRLDGKGLGGIYDEIIIGPSTADLIKRGYLSPSVVYAPLEVVSMEGVRTVGGDYVKAEMARKIDKPTITGSAVDHYHRLVYPAPAIAFCASVEHAKHTAEAFRARGFISACLDAKCSDEEREEVINRLAEGTLHVLTSCEIISEGTDIPRATAAILLRPTQSESLFLQQVGRILRPVYAPGLPLETDEQRLEAIKLGEKKRAIILDHVGNTLRHGFVESDRCWSLDGKPRKKRPNEDSDFAIRQCPDCYSYHPAACAACPSCGNEYDDNPRQIQEVEGELVELKELPLDKRAIIGKARTLNELVTTAQRLGYKKGWVTHTLEARKQPIDWKKLNALWKEGEKVSA